MWPWIRSVIFWPHTSHQPASSKERRLASLLRQVQELAAEAVRLAYVDQGYTGKEPASEAAEQGIELEVISHSEAKRRLSASAAALGGRAQLCLESARFRRLARDYERLPATLAGLHFVVFASLMLSRILA
jgi:hypothetical protein